MYPGERRGVADRVGFSNWKPQRGQIIGGKPRAGGQACVTENERRLLEAAKQMAAAPSQRSSSNVRPPSTGGQRRGGSICPNAVPKALPASRNASITVAPSAAAAKPPQQRSGAKLSSKSPCVSDKERQLLEMAREIAQAEREGRYLPAAARQPAPPPPQDLETTVVKTTTKRLVPQASTSQRGAIPKATRTLAAPTPRSAYAQDPRAMPVRRLQPPSRPVKEKPLWNPNTDPNSTALPVVAVPVEVVKPPTLASFAPPLRRDRIAAQQAAAQQAAAQQAAAQQAAAQQAAAQQAAAQQATYGTCGDKQDPKVLLASAKDVLNAADDVLAAMTGKNADPEEAFRRHYVLMGQLQGLNASLKKPIASPEPRVTVPVASVGRTGLRQISVPASVANSPDETIVSVSRNTGVARVLDLSFEKQFGPTFPTRSQSKPQPSQQQKALPAPARALNQFLSNLAEADRFERQELGEAVESIQKERRNRLFYGLEDTLLPNLRPQPQAGRASTLVCPGRTGAIGGGGGGGGGSRRRGGELLDTEIDLVGSDDELESPSTYRRKLSVPAYRQPAAAAAAAATESESESSDSEDEGDLDMDVAFARAKRFTRKSVGSYASRPTEAVGSRYQQQQPQWQYQQPQQQYRQLQPARSPPRVQQPQENLLDWLEPLPCDGDDENVLERSTTTSRTFTHMQPGDLIDWGPPEEKPSEMLFRLVKMHDVDL